MMDVDPHVGVEPQELLVFFRVRLESLVNFQGLSKLLRLRQNRQPALMPSRTVYQKCDRVELVRALIGQKRKLLQDIELSTAEKVKLPYDNSVTLRSTEFSDQHVVSAPVCGGNASWTK